MATSTTLTAVAQRIMLDLDLGFLVPNAFITNLGATSFTAPKFFLNSRQGSDHWASLGYIVTRMGAASSADYERPVGDVTNSTGAVAVSTWADSTLGTEDIEMWKYGIRRTTNVLDAINYARSQLFGSTYVPISDLSGGSNDGDMAATGTTAFTSIGTPTLSKSTTARRVPFGRKALRVLNDASSEGVRFPTIAMRQLRSMRWMTIVCSDVGGTTLAPYDITAAGTFSSGTSITVSEEEPQLVMSPWEVVPTDCKEATFQGVGTTSTSDNYYNMVWLYRMGNRRIELPSYVQEAYQTPMIFQGVPMYGGTTNNCYDALSMEFRALQENVDYKLVSNQPDANPNAILLMGDGYYEWPLFALARLTYYDLEGNLSAESDTTKCPLNLLAPFAEITLLDRVLRGKIPDVDWARLRTKAERQYNEANQSRPIEMPAEKHPYWVGPGGGMRL